MLLKYHKKTSPTLFGPSWNNLLHSLTNGECFPNFKLIITKCDKKLLQSVTGVTKCDFITKWDVTDENITEIGLFF